MFTALTAVAATLPLAVMVGTVGALIIVRFLLGVGEAVALPNFNRAVADWIPPAQRGLGIGIAIGSIGIGTAITPSPRLLGLMVTILADGLLPLCVSRSGGGPVA
ncbi:MAG: MFS transporter [Nitrospira sp.]|nr:MFS transporter [Nitrospira sp.]